MSNQRGTITVLIADDHEMTRKGIHFFLSQAPDMEVVGEAEDGDQVKQLVAELLPRVLLLDLVMPNLSPAELEIWARENYPETVTLILTAHDRDSYLYSMMEAGVAGYLDKRLNAGRLISCIRRAVRGETLFDQEQVERARRWKEEVSRKWENLSSREREVLEMLSEGVENKIIAAALSITINTVEKHLEKIYKKLEVTSRAAAICWWVEKNT